MPKPRNNPVDKDMYEAAIAADGRRTVAELGKDYDLKPALFSYYVNLYAEKNGLPLPKLVYTDSAKKPGAEVHFVERGRVDNFVRVSAPRFVDAGLGETLEFRMVCDREHKVILLLPREVEVESLDEACKVLINNGGPGSSVPIPMRFPEVPGAMMPKKDKRGTKAN